MELREKMQKLNKKAVLVAFIHWVISFATDRLVFQYELFQFSDTVSIAKALLAWGAKFAFLILLLILWQIIWKLALQIKAGNRELKKYGIYTFIYFVIMLLFFFLLFPGLWRLDELGTLKNATLILPHFWQGYLTSVFFIFALMLVPNPAGVVFIQIVVISLIVGYIVYRISYLVKQKKLALLMYLPFLLFPVIDSNFYPIRMSLYAFLELLFAFELFHIKYTKREIKKYHVWLLAGLAGILICWRTEAIYYIILAPLTFIILFFHETTRKIKIQFSISVFIFATILTSVQFMGNKIDSGKEYELTSIILPITPLVNTAYENNEKQMLDSIDKVLDTKILVEGYQNGESGIAMYWGKATELKRDYSDADFAEMKKVYYQLILKYPKVFLTERVETFIGSTGILDKTETMFQKDTSAKYVSFRETYHYKEPLFRSGFIQLLEFTDSDTMHNIVYSQIIPIIVLLATCIVLLIQRKWGYFFICASVCAKIPLIFLTAPSMLFMYYYSIYLIGAVWITMIIISKINKNVK